MITFTRQEDGTFSQAGQCETTHGRFQWLHDGRWDGGWAVEPVADCIVRMNLGGPYKYARYRIVSAVKKELVIKPTCAGCGMIAGIDCQHSVEYCFRRAEVTEALPITFNDDHQFNLSISVATDGKNFGQKKPKTVWFNSVRCAELFLIEHGYCKSVEAPVPIGNGVRLLAFLRGSDVARVGKRRRPSRLAKELVWGGQTPIKRLRKPRIFNSLPLQVSRGTTQRAPLAK
jgi:hypothetical protein